MHNQQTEELKEAHSKQIAELKEAHEAQLKQVKETQEKQLQQAKETQEKQRDEPRADAEPDEAHPRADADHIGGNSEATPGGAGRAQQGAGVKDNRSADTESEEYEGGFRQVEGAAERSTHTP